MVPNMLQNCQPISFLSSQAFAGWFYLQFALSTYKTAFECTQRRYEVVKLLQSVSHQRFKRKKGKISAFPKSSICIGLSALVLASLWWLLQKPKHFPFMHFFEPESLPGGMQNFKKWPFVRVAQPRALQHLSQLTHLTIMLDKNVKNGNDCQIWNIFESIDLHT